MLSEAEAIVVPFVKAAEDVEAGTLAAEVVVPLEKVKEEEVIVLEAMLAAEVVEAFEEEEVVEMTDPLDDWVAELDIELVELEMMLDEVEVGKAAEVLLPKELLEDATLAVLLVEATEDCVAVELL